MKRKATIVAAIVTFLAIWALSPGPAAGPKAHYHRSATGHRVSLRMGRRERHASWQWKKSTRPAESK